MAPKERVDPKGTTVSTAHQTGPPDLRFIHYNDVYHVEPGSREPVGGISRFQTVCNQYATSPEHTSQPDLLTFFSGDAFNPSLESSVTKGSHMVPVLNGTRVNAACLGNHDLDFGIEQFASLAGKCDFPWLCANVLDPALGEDVPLGNCKRTVMLTASNGIKVGVIGLVEREWLETINSLPPNLEYRSASATALELVPGLREQGAQIIIALTHQRQPNDEKLARKLPQGYLDMILGGHDHTYDHAVINGMHLLRSGTDFKQLSYIEAWRRPNTAHTWDFTITRRDIVSSIPEDPAAVATVHKLTSALKAKLERPIGYTAAPLDARFSTVRAKESNYGNFVCDLMRFHYNADCTIMAAGTIRGDQVYPAGVIKVKDVMNCYPFEDPCVVVEVTGEAILHTLENGVKLYPALEGRFPQVSGITFAFDPSKPEMQRCSNITVKGEPLDLQKKYVLCTRDYMVRGKDGFTSLMLDGHGGNAKSIVSEENGMLISTMLVQYFMSLKILGRWENWGSEMGRHWGGVQDGLHDVQPVKEPTISAGTHQNGSTTGPGPAEDDTSLVGNAQRAKAEAHDSPIDAEDSDDEDSSRANLPAVAISPSEHERKLMLIRKVVRRWWTAAGLKGQPKTCDQVENSTSVPWCRGIAPKLEGRIVCLGDAA
ncbi:hypothetical protein B0A48_04525 [Cryoendolithus antarcticus]|uniref:5'-Nucleotidase C-terminal domain-containing protein n=1 Tax=Cryoendolithus antarcticus TaxID=1507870 RepID=A0A1V8TFY6_9PEZI|nr:hypothetical protein B0A48_04525 [Cryoendolithus antarcticus]